MHFTEVMADINITIGWALLEEEPDGQKCTICKEICWQKCYRICVKGNPRLIKTAMVVCQSCRNSFEETEDL